MQHVYDMYTVYGFHYFLSSMLLIGSTEETGLAPIRDTRGLFGVSFCAFGTWKAHRSHIGRFFLWLLSKCESTSDKNTWLIHADTACTQRRARWATMDDAVFVCPDSSQWDFGVGNFVPVESDQTITIAWLWLASFCSRTLRSRGSTMFSQHPHCIDVSKSMVALLQVWHGKRGCNQLRTSCSELSMLLEWVAWRLRHMPSMCSCCDLDSRLCSQCVLCCWLGTVLAVGMISDSGLEITVAGKQSATNMLAKTHCYELTTHRFPCHPGRHCWVSVSESLCLAQSSSKSRRTILWTSI